MKKLIVLIACLSLAIGFASCIDQSKDSMPMAPETTATVDKAQAPKLNISDITCTEGGALVHFVLVHNSFTAAELGSATLQFTFTVNGGPAQTATATFDKTAGKTAHFSTVLPAVTSGTVSITSATLTVGGQTILLHNTMTKQLDCRATGTLQICKTMAPGTNVPTGTRFTFTVSGRSTPVSVAPESCVTLTGIPAGNVIVTETPSRTFVVTAITFLGGIGTVNVPAGSANATIVAGQPTEVQFTNAQRQTGLLEICKETQAGLTGTFSFTSPAFSGVQSITVPAGMAGPVCGPLMPVTAGMVTITEAPTPGSALIGVHIIGPGSLIGVVGTTATVSVPPAGGIPTPTQVVFTNAPATGSGR